MRSLRLVLLWSTVALGTIAAPPSPPVPGPLPIPERVSVELRAWKTPATGPTTAIASAGSIPRLGEGGTAYLLTGGFDAAGEPRRSLCTGQVGSGSIDPDAARNAVHVWRVDSRVLTATMENLVVHVAWSRTDASRPGETRSTAGGFTTLTMAEGETHTLDFLPSPDPPDACGESLRIDVEVAVVEDERFARDRIAYDLWLLDRSPSGEESSRRLSLEGTQGESLEFEFPDLAWPLANAKFSDGRPAEARATVQGSLRGRLRDDGSIDLLLHADRRVHLERQGASGTGGIGDGGRKTLRLLPGETLGLPLPAAKGVHAQSLDGKWGSTFGAPGMTTEGVDFGGPEDGVDVTPEAISVDFAKFLKGHSMSLRLTARRAGA